MSEEIQGWRDIIQQNGKIIQPQLTIPKSIADELDSDFSDIDATFLTSPWSTRAIAR